MKISLRDYNREIQKLIDDGHYEEAVAHCRYILKEYPKCIETYRNLGKILLELKKYPEAMDIFSRVLTAFPDDFISHVGLSIIYESQNDLDLAILHMEQAFDVQPSNLAIQDELKRLFGQRDGEQPIKIRLTRGALVRMYARGELYQQAITEINSILEEYPRRIDLEVILARMYFLSGNLDNAGSMCNQIIEKIPFCFEANQILQEIYTNQKDIEGATVFKNRLISLDPYYRFIDSPFSNQDVPDNQIQLEKLIYTPSDEPDIQVSVWTNSSEPQWESKSAENIDWLQGLPDQNGNPIEDLKKLSENTNVPVSLATDDSTENSTHLPSWMQDLRRAAPQISDEHILESTHDTTKKDDNLNQESVIGNMENNEKSAEEILQGVLDQDHSLSENTAQIPQVTNDDLASLFSDLNEGKMDDDTLHAISDEEKSTTSSDWKSQYSRSESNESPQPQPQDIPEWLRNLDDKETHAKEDVDAMPDWLKNLQAESNPDADNSINPSPDTDHKTFESQPSESLLSDYSTIADSNTPIDNPPQRIEVNNGWEKADRSEIDANETENNIDNVAESDDLSPKSSDDTIPAWVRSVLLATDSSAPVISSDTIQTGPLTQEKYNPSSSKPAESISEESLGSQSESGIISQQTNDELLDWLRGLKSEEEINQPAESESSPSEAAIIEKIGVENPAVSDRVEEFASASDAVSSITSDPLESARVASVEEDNKGLNETLSESLMPGLQFDQALVSEDSKTLDMNTVGVGEPPSPSDLLPQEIISDPERDHLVQEKEVEVTHISTEGQIDRDLNRELPSSFEQMVDAGHNFEQLMQEMNAVAVEQGKDYLFWQKLGDVFADHNKLSDALSAYQKAEEILLKSISS